MVMTAAAVNGGCAITYAGLQWKTASDVLIKSDPTRDPGVFHVSCL